PELIRRSPSGRVLKGADTKMTRRYAGQNGAGQLGFALDQFTGGYYRQAAGSGNPQRMHGFADNVFAQHRPERRTAVASAGIRRSARPFKLDIEPRALRRNLLAQQDRPAVPQHRKMPELVPRVGLSQRLGAFRNPVARQHGSTLI